MEGLLIAEQLSRLAPLLPAERLPWRFPDDRTAVLPLLGERSLLIASRPPNPVVQLTEGAPEAARPNSPFQEQLRARAGGRLLAATQPQLDRVLRLRFAGEESFVPTPPVELVVELTGRNANLVLLDEAGTILGVERTVLADRNRYRELKVGLKYVPPPPYDKLDPRFADDEQLRAALRGKLLSQVGRVIDGIGPQLGAALGRAVREAWEESIADAGGEGPPKRGGPGEPAEEASVSEPLDGAALELALVQLRRLVEAPAEFLERHGDARGPLELRAAERRDQRLQLLRGRAKKALELARRRLADAERAAAGADGADELRAEGDLLLAYARTVPTGAAEATLTGFDGQPVTLELDPRLDAAGNARQRYDQAKRREARAERALGQLDELEEAVRTAEQDLSSLDELSDEEVAARAAELEAKRPQASASNQPGIRFQGPHGFEVVVGRNARDNDKVTFEVGRSRDLWFHAQGYRGSHVIVRSGGNEVPFETVLFAARLAAGYSEAFRSDNVPVDYTVRKNVWKVKGGAPGAVNFTQHRTVYVTPARDDEGASGG